MKTLAAETVPAAVISIGNIRGSVSAASSTPLYPAMVAIDDSASMLCARVMRGMSSIDNAVAPVCASAPIASGRSQRIGEADHRLAGSQQRRAQEERTEPAG